jgi:hypothetical protein
MVLAGDFCFLKGEMAVFTSCSSSGTTSFALLVSKRKEHGLETWALFIDLFRAFDHFAKVLRRLHFGAKVKVKIGEEDSELDSTIGVRQGS